MAHAPACARAHRDHMFRRSTQRPTTTTPEATSQRRIRHMGLRRALEMLEAGERINDGLYRWTLTQPRALTFRPGLG